MRLKQIRVNHELLTQFLTQGNRTRASVVEKGIPAGATLWDVRIHGRECWIEIEHPDFPNVEYGERTPFLEIVIRAQDDDPPKAISA